MAHPHEQVFNTNHYVWSTRDKLGYGATGAVFVGYNKQSGDRVAIKVFTHGADFKALTREIDVVKALPPHNNIVSLFGVEEERSIQQTVIVMELCTGGSLYEVIDSPENAYGLNELEFTQVMHDVANGLHHLRKNNFVHRDIKPGNIMRCQNPDGSYVFKLADFGTARELGPGETFFSLHGTEEYLYPGMYERALVNPQKKKEFLAKVDLWSVGATFFHAATGRLPFQPFRKRDDRELMYRIISQKEPGVISGWQLELNGQITYSRTLAKDTQISLGLKLLLTPVLAGLLENDFRRMMDFDEFFKCIERIHRKRVIDVFCVYSCTCHKIYIDPEERNGVDKLKELIQHQTGLDPQYQELFYENLPYHPKELVTASKLPHTTPDRPIFVFGGPVKRTSDLESPILPSLPSIPQGLALANDVQFAKECAKVMWCFRFVTEQIDKMFKHMHQAALCFSFTVHHEYTLLEQKMSSMDQLNEATCRVLSSQITGLRNLKDVLGVVNQSADRQFMNELHRLDQDVKSKETALGKTREAPSAMRNKINRIKAEALSITDSWDLKYCSEIFHRSVETLQFMVRSVDSNYRTFVKERKHKTMSGHDQKVHEFTKIKLHQKLVEAQEKVVHLLTGRDQVYSKLGEWFVRVIPLRNDIVDIGTRIRAHADECSHQLEVLNRWEYNHMQSLQNVPQRISGILKDTLHHPRNPSYPPSQPEVSRQSLTKLMSSTTELGKAVDAQKDLLQRLRIAGASQPQQKHLVSRNAN